MGPIKFFCHIFVLITCLLSKNTFSTILEGRQCPLNCICYPDSLSNLASWEWIESDVHSNPDDPHDEDFNPYTEHNEVYNNPKTSSPLRKKDVFQTVTCILRNDFPTDLSEIFSQIHPSTQVLSILQGAGSGNITIGRIHFEKLTQLIGIDIQGYKDVDSEFSHRQSSFRLEADALLPLRKLTYLSLDNVLLQQRSVIMPIEEYTSKIVRVRKIGFHFNSTYDEDDGVFSDLQSQLIFLSPKKSKIREPIVPYSVYKSASKNKRIVETKEKPPEPKIAVAFTDIPSLLHLRISECNMQDISWDMFHRLQSLKFLLLERNNLLFLPDFVFYATSNLTTLSLSGNRILSLQTVGLAGLLYLQKLDVTHNNITHLSELSLPPFPHLEVADFRYNPIEAIFPNTFEVMNATKSLYLGNPLISLQIFPNSFYGLTSLLNLQITNIRIDFLERPMFKGLSVLKVLVMDGQIKRISYDAFSEISKLEKLILRKCKIEKISMDAFFGLTSLVELDLSHNRFTFLPPGIFDEQSSLREIYLQYNQLTTLPQNLFKNTPSKLIRLEGNPWHCSCDMNSWNPAKINQVKSYFVPKNETFCQRQYDKGSMCRQDGEKGFQVKYIYEKRVSPVCQTPKKFNQRNVFDVMRKELRYCSQQSSRISFDSNLGIIKSKNKTIKGIKPTEQLLKEKEKALFFLKLGKIRKPSSKESISAIQNKKNDISQDNTTENTEMKKNFTTSLPTTEPSIEHKSTIPRSITDRHDNTINLNRKETEEHLGISEGSTSTYPMDKPTMSNLINLITYTNSVSLPKPFPTQAVIQLNSFQSLKSKLNTPRSFKSTKNDDFIQLRSKTISKKALKFAKFYTTTEETIGQPN